MTPVPFLTHAEVLVLLVQLSSLLVVGLLLGRLAARLGLPAIVGELSAGILLGPTLLGNLAPVVFDWLFPANPSQMHLLDAVGQLGVLLLVGIAGVSLDLSMVRRAGVTATRISVAGLVIPLSLGVLVGHLAPASLIPGDTHRWVFAMFLGVAMCVTAIPVIAKTLADMKLTHRDVGQLTLTAAALDDTVGWFLLSVVSALATVGLSAGRITMAVLFILGYIALAALIGRPLVRAVLRLAARSDEPGVTAVTAVIIILLSAAGAHALGMEAVFGAFVGGTLIGAPGAVDKKMLMPLRTIVLSVLAPVFLASVGLRMDLTTLADADVLLAAVVALLVATVGKFSGAYLGALGRLSRWESLAIGAGMNSRGVVEIIVGMVGLRLGVLNTATFTIIGLIAVATSVMAAPILRLTMSRVSHNADELLRKAEHEAWVPTATPR